ncbi:carbohydrate kinase family protein [Demequina sp. SYSU T00039]|uniref:Carbohydrate kinase family protein n=1 Tax=Demequina lignilytica TaxID=3051663 RepID=A0AAW7M7A6_9MICO|nr:MULTISPECIES: carbohydrate kinase family protein [unclassified Demequina]MDN4486890.1 carbohydrate kinase family protein [Demequina sp. SYSU T00039]MDN4489574.1 carbohydrate kinase family protein [Demequina sp. SYSU T00068]
MSDRVLVVGPTSENQLVALDALPRPEPHTVFALGHRTVLGGTSAGKALHLVDAGLSPTLLTTRGDDAAGDALMAQLRACGVDVREVRAEGPTERHLNLMAADGGRVSIYLQPSGPLPAEELRRARSVALAAMTDAAAVFLDLSDVGRALIPEATALAHEVWCDVHDYDGMDGFHRPFVDAADVLIMNRDRIRNPGSYLRDRIAAGTTLAVCTLGADGALGATADGAMVRIAAPEVAVVDANGAGDAFAAGLMAFAVEVGGASRITGELLGQALEAGAAQSARAVGSAQISPLLERHGAG